MLFIKYLRIWRSLLQSRQKLQEKKSQKKPKENGKQLTYRGTKLRIISTSQKPRKCERGVKYLTH